MKTKRVNRYYCEFCKKSGCSAGHMRKHERACTMNPGRVCGVCKMLGATQGPLGDLRNLLPAFGAGNLMNEALPQLRKAANNCPACMFAALRQSEALEWATDFNWDEEMSAVWAELNNRESRECQHG